MKKSIMMIAVVMLAFSGNGVAQTLEELAEIVRQAANSERCRTGAHEKPEEMVTIRDGNKPWDLETAGVDELSMSSQVDAHPLREGRDDFPVLSQGI